jgi:hypothetical protein
VEAWPDGRDAKTESTVVMALLPSEFAELEPFAAKWSLATERERYHERLTSSMEDMQAFYEVTFPRADDARKYLDQFPLDALPDDATHLLHLLYSLISVSFAVECWKQPHVPDSGAAYLDLVLESTP